MMFDLTPVNTAHAVVLVVVAILCYLAFRLVITRASDYKIYQFQHEEFMWRFGKPDAIIVIDKKEGTDTTQPEDSENVSETETKN